MIDRALNYGRQNVADYLRDSLPFQTVLDLGAGHGDDLGTARSLSPRASLHGVEVFVPYQEELASTGIVVHELDLEHDRLPFLDEQVDVIIANQILEHTKEVFWILHEISRVLRLGGSFIVGIPNLAALHNRLLLLCGFQPTPLKNASAHVRGYTRRDFRSLLDSGFESGYRLRSWSGSNFYPFPPGPAKRLATLFPSMAWGLFMRLTKEDVYAGGYLRYPVDAQLETNFWSGERRVTANPTSSAHERHRE